MELITLLSKYSVDCIATALFSCFIVFGVRKKLKLPEKANRLLPFGVAFLIYSIATLFNLTTVDEVINKSMTAGGLATVIYAFCGGYSLTKEEELKKLMGTLLKTVVADEQIAKITDEIIQGLESNEDDALKIIKISNLIKANLSEEVTEDEIKAVTAVFVQTYREFANKKS